MSPRTKTATNLIWNMVTNGSAFGPVKNSPHYCSVPLPLNTLGTVETLYLCLISFSSFGPIPRFYNLLTIKFFSCMHYFIFLYKYKYHMIAFLKKIRRLLKIQPRVISKFASIHGRYPSS